MINVKVDIKTKGKYKPINLFSAVDNGIRRRLPKFTARNFKRAILNNIYSNKFGFTLSDSWKAFKKAKGWDLRPFMAEGHYEKSIKIFSSDGHLTVGFTRRSFHPRSKLSMGEVARILEYGALDANVPPRPLWRLTFKEFFKDYDKKVKKVLIDEINANI